MIGNNQLQLGSSEFVSGMSSTDYSADGGLGTSCVGLNPFVVPGVMYGLANPTDASTNLSGNLVASSDDSQTVSPETRIAIDDAGNIYSLSSSGVWTKRITGLSNTYSFPETDIVPFGGTGGSFNYATSGSKLMQINTSAWTKTENFQSLADASALHPQLVFENTLWIGDGKNIATLASDQTTFTAASAWVLNGNEKIVALGIDPGTGLMMVSVANAYNAGDSIQQPGVVYLWNGATIKPTRKIIVDDLITSFTSVEGSVVCGTGSGKLGLWTGAGIKFLRKLKTNGTFLKADLPYKHHVTNIGDVLHVVDGKNILSWGSIVAGKKGFYNTAYNSLNSNNIGIVMRAGSNKLGIGFSSSKFETFDFSSTSAGIPSIYFDNNYFPRPVWIRRVRIITTGVTTTAGLGSVLLTDENGVSVNTVPVSFIVPAAQSPKYVFDFDFETKLQGLSSRINLDTQGVGIVQVYYYYDGAE